MTQSSQLPQRTRATPMGWTRRTWLARNSAALLVAATPSALRRRSAGIRQPRVDRAQAVRMTGHVARIEPERFEALARQGVEAARAAGARYADVRLTRTVQHHFEFNGPAAFCRDVELVGVGVRALVDGYWGFTASPTCDSDEVVRLAREAAAQAKVNAAGPPRTVELGTVPAANGRWITPTRIDPFSVSVDEKADYMAYWEHCANRLGLAIYTMSSYLHFARQERTVATSEGACVSQTLYESGGVILIVDGVGDLVGVNVQGIDACGKGWELFLDAKIPEQILPMPEQIKAKRAIPSKPATVGRYTLVCDGAVMGRLVEQTFGIATQLDRALGYEANAGGTSFLTDPLGMLGTLTVASPLVTVTANRSAPAELATVKWDDEGVTPQDCTLVKDGVLHDFQTTREQAAWLAPYYQKAGRPVRTHGYAGAEDALAITLQQMPNLALEPGTAAVSMEDLIADVKDGILVTEVTELLGMRTDQQARNGYFQGTMRQIRNGRLGAMLHGGAVLFNTLDLWKHVTALGGPATQGVYASTGLYDATALYAKFFALPVCKGQPQQLTSHSARGVAATVTDQSLIDIGRKA